MPIEIRRKDDIRTKVKRHPALGQSTMFCEIIVFDKEKEIGFDFGWADSKRGLAWEEDYSNYHEINYVVEGACEVTDLETGETFTALPDDLYILDRRIACSCRTGDQVLLVVPPTRQIFLEKLIPTADEEW